MAKRVNWSGLSKRRGPLFFFFLFSFRKLSVDQAFELLLEEVRMIIKFLLGDKSNLRLMGIEVNTVIARVIALLHLHMLRVPLKAKMQVS